MVDDEEIIASILALILQGEGFNATSFTEPLEALQAVFLAAPDLLITNIMMPTLTGVELAIQVKRRCPECKVVLFSGAIGASALVEDARSNGHHFELLPKPVHPVELLKTIQEMVESAGCIVGTDLVQAIVTPNEA